MKQPPPAPSLQSVIRADFPTVGEIFLRFPDDWSLVERLGTPAVNTLPLYVASRVPVLHDALSEKLRSDGWRAVSFALFQPLPSGYVQATALPLGFEPWKLPVVANSLNMQPILGAQVWQRAETAIARDLYSGMMNLLAFSPQGWQATFKAAWDAIERALGARKIYLAVSERRMGIWTELPTTLGYHPDPRHAGWWVKVQSGKG